MQVEQILEIINEHIEGHEADDLENYQLEDVEGAEGLVFNFIDGVGGREGGGEEVWRVIEAEVKETGEKFYFEIVGWYGSGYGTEYQGDWYQVWPQEVMKTIYVDKKPE